MLAAQRSSKHRYGAILAVFAVWAALFDIAGAADLRSTIGDQSVVRSTQPQTVPDTDDAASVPPQQVLSPFPQQGDLAYGASNGGSYFDDCNCGPACQNWVDVDFLLWFRRGRSLPPLAAVGNPTPSTIVYGNDTVGTNATPGGRVELGRWLDDTHTVGYGFRGFLLGDSDTNFNVSQPAGGVALGVPFFNVTTGAPDVFLVADPNGNPAYGGSINVKTTSSVYGADVFLRFLVCDTGAVRVDFLTGYQYTMIDESLVMTSQLDQPGVTVRDSFRTVNAFNGGTVGLKYQWFGPRVHCDFLTKIAFGDMHETVLVSNDGSTNGGLFARSTNIGLNGRNVFAVLPELGANLVVPMGRRWDFNVGYSFLFWSDVLQPGAQIDRGVNLGTTPPNRPTTVLNQNDYWVHGVNFGLTRRF